MIDRALRASPNAIGQIADLSRFQPASKSLSCGGLGLRGVGACRCRRSAGSSAKKGEQGARPGMAEPQQILCSRHADVEQAALFGKLGRAAIDTGQQIGFAAALEDDRKL